MENFDKRILRDRRKQPTPLLSRYIFLGRRGSFRRNTDRERGGYVDRYSSGLFSILILILALNILDAIFTIIVLDHRGWELNPLVRSAIQIYGDKFWIWKFGIVSGSLIVLCLHSKFRRVKTIIMAVCSIYTLVVLYQIFLITYRLPEVP